MTLFEHKSETGISLWVNNAKNISGEIQQVRPNKEKVTTVETKATKSFVKKTINAAKVCLWV